MTDDIETILSAAVTAAARAAMFAQESDDAVVNARVAEACAQVVTAAVSVQNANIARRLFVKVKEGQE